MSKSVNVWMQESCGRRLRFCVRTILHVVELSVQMSTATPSSATRSWWGPSHTTSTTSHQEVYSPASNAGYLLPKFALVLCSLLWESFHSINPTKDGQLKLCCICKAEPSEEFITRVQFIHEQNWAVFFCCYECRFLSQLCFSLISMHLKNDS